jgi:hypothetical protein
MNQDSADQTVQIVSLRKLKLETLTGTQTGTNRKPGQIGDGQIGDDKSGTIGDDKSGRDDKSGTRQIGDSNPFLRIDHSAVKLLARDSAISRSTSDSLMPSALARSAP